MRNIAKGYYALRWKILERDNYTCQYCGQHAPDVKLEVDHIKAVEDGGTDEPENLKTSCYACNMGKSGLSIIIKRRKNQNLPITTLTFFDPFNRTGEKATGKTGELLKTIKQTDHYLTLKELATTLGVSINAVSVMKARLRKYGLLNRMPCSAHNFTYLRK